MTVLSSSTDNPLQAPDMAKLKTYLVGIISRQLEARPVAHDRRQQVVQTMLEQSYERTKVQLTPTVRAQLFKDVTNELLGYGPIQQFLDDPDVNEIMVNGPNKVYLERRGKLVKTNVVFEDDDHVLRVIERIVFPLGQHVDADSPTVDTRLPDGSRVNAVIPPVAIDGPSITIRKFRKDKLSIDQLIEFGSLTMFMAEFLRSCVIARLNIVISGGTGSGKTTLLNVLSSFIPEDERIVTIEDAAELQLLQDHVVRLESRPQSADGQSGITIRELVRNSLRMRPDRVVVGECRGGETLDILQAMNTGHDGSLTTVHANSPRDAISRMETMALMSGLEMPLKVIREQIASAIDLIVQQSRLRDGERKITAITDVAGMEGDTVVLRDIFKFEQTGVDPDGKVLGELKPTGIRPLFSPRLEVSGFKLGPEMFGANLSDIISSNMDKGRRRK
jgi:pilus assembly protein CpaF